MEAHMATAANDRTEKDDTRTLSNDSTPRRASILRSRPPELRTAEAIVHKYEQIQEALEHEAITPKRAEQMNQTLKGITDIAKLELQWYSLAARFGKKVPVPRSAILRNMLGLPVDVSPSDGEAVRKLVPEK